MKSTIKAFALLVALTQFISIPAFSQMNNKSIDVLGRALPFIPHIKIGDQKVGIVFDPESPVSKSEKDILMQRLGKGYTIGKYTLVGHTVKVTELDQLVHLDIIIVTNGIELFQGRIFKKAQDHHLLTVSSDMDCVLRGNCVLGIAVSPKVKMVLNGRARAECRINFAQALRLLLQEV